MIYLIQKRFPKLFLKISFFFAFFSLPLVAQEIETLDPCAESANSNCFLSVINAAKLTLENQKQIDISYENIDVQAGLARQAAGPFDPLANLQYQSSVNRLHQFTSPPLFKTKNSTFTSQFNGSLTKTFRAGTMITATAEVEEIRTKFLPGPIYGKTVPDYTLFFQIQQPLLRNFLFGYTAMQERSQQLQVSVAWYSAIFQVSNSLALTVTQYWQLLSAKKQIAIHEEAIKQYVYLHDKTKSLIKAQVIAAVDIDQVDAQIAIEKANLAGAKQLYIVAYENLKFDMGVGDQCLSCEKKWELEEYPPIQGHESPESLPCEFVMGRSKSLYMNRADIRAAEINEEAVELLLTGSRNLSLPQLDVFGSYDYNKVRNMTNPPPSASGSRQEEVVVGVIFSYPLHNDYALGLVQQQRALRNQAYLQTKLLKEQMSANFFQLLESHYLLIEEIHEATLAVELYTRVVQNELKKLDAGFSSVFVVITLQQNLTQNQLILDQAFSSYAQNIIQYRFITGTLLKLTDPYCCDFEVEPLTLWPNLL